jgi:hypothetical protein
MYEAIISKREQSLQYWLESKMSSRWIQPEFQREVRRRDPGQRCLAR